MKSTAGLFRRAHLQDYMSFDGLAEGWVVWSEESARSVLAYRPDVFDSESFPPPCLPTIYVSQGRRSRYPGRRSNPDGRWYVTLYLEPEVSTDADTYEDRTEAVEAARDLAERFAAGEVDYRGLYQVPRPAYLDRLDDLTGRGT